MKPICISCQRFFKPKKCGIYFVEGMPATQHRPVPGTAEPENWKPYKLWAGDRYECEGCGSAIIVGAGLYPIAEHFQEGFAQTVENYGATLQVNDC